MSRISRRWRSRVAARRRQSSQAPDSRLRVRGGVARAPRMLRMLRRWRFHVAARRRRSSPIPRPWFRAYGNAARALRMSRRRHTEAAACRLRSSPPPRGRLRGRGGIGRRLRSSSPLCHRARGHGGAGDAPRTSRRRHTGIAACRPRASPPAGDLLLDGQPNGHTGGSTACGKTVLRAKLRRDRRRSLCSFATAVVRRTAPCPAAGRGGAVRAVSASGNWVPRG